jgi:hypothetical protein
MLVYGDRKFCVRTSELFENCRARVQQTNLASLDELRSLLVFAGQFEQAIADAAVNSVSLREFTVATCDLTDCLARFFCRKFISEENWDGKEMLMQSLDRIGRLLAGAPSLNSEMVTVKIPEGYAFYALFPEQYCVTALNWGQQHSDLREAFVIGLRSIGTSLSAVVRETLCHIGCKAQRLTVRPGGHPFQRRVTLPAIHIAPDCPVVIVDEGPGISGSSMAAVARAFISAGFGKIHFLPGHSNEPGIAATREVRGIWRQSPRHVTSLEKIRWHGLSLEQSLLEESAKFSGRHHQPERIENISGGLWQMFLPKNKMDWPASPPQFERMKYLCTSPEGNSIIWKFSGLHTDENLSGASEAELQRLSFLAHAGYSPEPFGTFRGFVAMPWIDGVRLTRGDAKDSSVLKRVGNYIFDAAQPPLSSMENEIAVERLANMLYCNTRESLGEAAAESSSALAEAALATEAPLAYGDGHLAPQEWVRANDGRIFKADAEGHAHDHTLIGEQSVLWDIAGAFIEWNLNMQSAIPLMQALAGKGMQVNRAALAFYRAAYAAFRVGLMSLGCSQVADDRDREQFRQARGFYLNQLAGILKQEGFAVQSAH